MDLRTRDAQFGATHTHSSWSHSPYSKRGFRGSSASLADMPAAGVQYLTPHWSWIINSIQCFLQYNVLAILPYWYYLYAFGILYYIFWLVRINLHKSLIISFRPFNYSGWITCLRVFRVYSIVGKAYYLFNKLSTRIIDDDWRITAVIKLAINFERTLADIVIVFIHVQYSELVQYTVTYSIVHTVGSFILIQYSTIYILTDWH